MTSSDSPRKVGPKRGRLEPPYARETALPEGTWLVCRHLGLLPSRPQTGLWEATLATHLIRPYYLMSPQETLLASSGIFTRPPWVVQGRSWQRQARDAPVPG